MEVISMTKKICLITGATDGIGKATGGAVCDPDEFYRRVFGVGAGKELAESVYDDGVDRDDGAGLQEFDPDRRLCE